VNPSLRVLYKKDWRVTRNIERILQRESRFKVLFILLFGSGLWLGLFLLFLRGFTFLDTLGGVGFMVTRHLFAFFFFSLGLMLALSNVMTAYSTVFRSRETTDLLTRPYSARQIVTYKFIESCLLSSWAFFAIIVPFAGAYAWHESLPLLFSAWTLIFSIPFLVLYCGLGALVALAAVRWIPRGRTGLFILLLLALAAFVILYLRRAPPRAFDETTFIISRLVPGLQIASWPLAPNWWTAEGIMALTHGQYGRGALLWCVLAANALLVLLLVQETGAATFYTAYQRLTASGARARRRPVLLPWLDRALAALGGETRALVLKDVRTFLRDPIQWSQALIFFGLLGLYFASLRSFRYNLLPAEWRNIIVFLNVFSVTAVLCSLASRFVYPQLSIEGQGFWILGLSPVTMSRILLTKFALAFAATLSVSVGLMLLSTHMLQVQPLVQAMALAVAAAVALAVSGLATGLGAVFIDLKQSNPMAIVSSLGGTINLTLSLGFMLAAIFPFALLFHLFYRERITDAMLHRGLAWAALWLVAITLATTVLPLYAGYRSLRRRDY
jgi:ABC-2 type transport system permease protein